MQLNSERIMKFMIQSIRNGCLFAGLTLLALTAPLGAQGFASHAVDVAAGAGASSQSDNHSADGNIHISYTGSASYHLTSRLASGVEYSWLPLDSEKGPNVGVHSQLMGLASRFTVLPSWHTAPYVVLAVGYDRLSDVPTGSGSTAYNGIYGDAGLGLSVYATKHWGVRPEVRYEYQSYFSGPLSSFGSIRGTMSVFYQFGGKDSSKM